MIDDIMKKKPKDGLIKKFVPSDLECYNACKEMYEAFQKGELK